MSIGKINHKLRYQKNLTLNQLYPHKDKSVCACGCGKKLTPKRQKWATNECQSKAVIRFMVIKGNTKVIRQQLQLRDKGRCATCRVVSEKWQADHIVPVFLGGGGCDLTNFQTLCPTCHESKTKNQMQFKKK